MPTAEQVLNGLARITNTWTWLAVVWHGYLAVLLVGLAAGVRPSRRVSGILAGLPLLSVSVMAWIGGNSFNGSVFGLVGILVLAISARLARTPLTLARPRAVIPGVVMIALGWVYPHFLETTSFASYLYSAPTGLIPCPTLSVVIGLGIVAGSFWSRAWSVVMTVTGLFYGLFGAIRLGVSLDWILAVGALFLSFPSTVGLKKHEQVHS